VEDLESDIQAQGTLEPESVDTGTPQEDLGLGVGDSGEATPDGGTVSGIADLSRDQLEQKHSDLLRGFTQTSEEKGRIKAELDELRNWRGRVEQAIQDPDSLQLLLNRAKQARGEPIDNTPDTNPVEAVAEKYGIETDFATAILGFMRDSGFLERTDPRLRSAEEAITMFSQNHLDSEWRDIAQQFPGADNFKDRVFDMLRSTQNSIPMEQALHAVSQGQLAAAKARTKLDAEIKEKAKAQLPSGAPRTEPPPRTPASRTNVMGEEHRYKKDPAAAFFDSAKEQSIDLDALFKRKNW